MDDGRSVAFDRVLTRDEMISRVEALSLHDIRAAGAKALLSRPTVASVGPVAKVMTPDRIAAHVAGARGS